MPVVYFVKHIVLFVFVWSYLSWFLFYYLGFEHPTMSDEDLARLQSVDILIVSALLASNYRIMQQLPRLKWMHSLASGNESVLLSVLLLLFF